MQFIRGISMSVSNDFHDFIFDAFDGIVVIIYVSCHIIVFIYIAVCIVIIMESPKFLLVARSLPLSNARRCVRSILLARVSSQFRDILAKRIPRDRGSQLSDYRDKFSEKFYRWK